MLNELLLLFLRIKLLHCLLLLWAHDLILWHVCLIIILWLLIWFTYGILFVQNIDRVWGLLLLGDLILILIVWWDSRWLLHPLLIATIAGRKLRGFILLGTLVLFIWVTLFRFFCYYRNILWFLLYLLYHILIFIG